jgi:hypothetical protein
MGYRLKRKCTKTGSCPGGILNTPNQGFLGVNKGARAKCPVYKIPLIHRNATIFSGISEYNITVYYFRHYNKLLKYW